MIGRGVSQAASSRNRTIHQGRTKDRGRNNQFGVKGKVSDTLRD